MFLDQQSLNALVLFVLEHLMLKKKWNLKNLHYLWGEKLKRKLYKMI